VSYDGAISLEEWQGVLARILKECPEAPSFDTISDARGPHTMLRFEEVIELAKINIRMGMQGRPRRAVTIAGSKVHFGISRTLEAISDDTGPVKRLTTESVAQAATFLGRPEELIHAELHAVEEVKIGRVVPAAVDGEDRCGEES
jgi:hypothetical protein